MGRAVPGETSTIMKVFAVLLLAALAYAAPRPNPSLRLMPPLMPGTHTTVTVIPDTMVPTADTTVLDGVDTMVDTTDTQDTDTDTGSVMLRLKPTLPSSTPASTAMDLPTDTLIMAMELTPAL